MVLGSQGGRYDRSQIEASNAVEVLLWGGERRVASLLRYVGGRHVAENIAYQYSAKNIVRFVRRLDPQLLFVVCGADAGGVLRGSDIGERTGVPYCLYL